MTDIATALATPALTPFEGLPVVTCGIEIPGAAGGLQPALKIEPQEFHQGEELYVVFRLEVAKVRHEPIVKDELRGAQRRVHTAKVTDATIIDGDTVQEAIVAQRIKIAKAKEAAAGVQSIAGMGWGEDPEAEALALEHGDGQHATGLRDGCPLCEAEADAERDEADNEGAAADAAAAAEAQERASNA